MIDTLECDVLIIGAGAAGLRAAAESVKCGARTLIVTKGIAGKDAASFYRISPTKGIQAAMNSAESRLLISEIMEAADGEADESLVEALVGGSCGELEYIAGLGVKLDKQRYKGCFGKSQTAFKILDVSQFFERLLANLGGAQIIEKTQVIELLMSHGRFCGARRLAARCSSRPRHA